MEENGIPRIEQQREHKIEYLDWGGNSQVGLIQVYGMKGH